jgi:hypothetical protein
MVGIPAGGRRREFTADQVRHARLIEALHRKGVVLSRLARANLAFDAIQAYVIISAPFNSCPGHPSALPTIAHFARMISTYVCACLGLLTAFEKYVPKDL